MSDRAQAKVNYDKTDRAKGKKQVRDLQKKIDTLASQLVAGAWARAPAPHKLRGEVKADQVTWAKLVQQETKLLKRMSAAKTHAGRAKASRTTAKEFPQFQSPFAVAPPAAPRPKQSGPTSRAKSRQKIKNALKVGAPESDSSLSTPEPEIKDESDSPEPKIKSEPASSDAVDVPDLLPDNKANEHVDEPGRSASPNAAEGLGAIAEPADEEKLQQLAQFFAEKPDSKGKSKAAGESTSRSSASNSGDPKSEAKAEDNGSDLADQRPHKAKAAGESTSRSSASNSGDPKSEAKAEENGSDLADQRPHKSKELDSKIDTRSAKTRERLQRASRFHSKAWEEDPNWMI